MAIDRNIKIEDLVKELQGHTGSGYKLEKSNRETENKEGRHLITYIFTLSIKED